MKKTHRPLEHILKDLAEVAKQEESLFNKKEAFNKELKLLEVAVKNAITENS